MDPGQNRKEQKMSKKSFVKALISDNTAANCFFGGYTYGERRENLRWFWEKCCKAKMDERIQTSDVNAYMITVCRGLSCTHESLGFSAVECYDLRFVEFTRRGCEALAKEMWQAEYDKRNGMWSGEHIDTLEEWVELQTQCMG